MTQFKEGTIYTVVNGINVNPRTKENRKMNFCTDCGFFDLTGETKKHRHPITNQFCNGKFEEFRPMTMLETNILSIDFEDTDIHELEAMTSLKNAILNAANSVIGCEDGEIDGVVVGNKIFLYDDLDGGAGFVENLLDNFTDVILRANELVNNPQNTCHDACLECLISYRRRRDIPLLKKSLIAPHLRSLANSIIRKEIIKSVQIVNGNFQKIADKDSLVTIFKKELVGKHIFQVISQPESTDGAEQLRALLYGANKEILISTLYVSNRSIPWKDGTFESFEQILLNIKRLKPDIKITIIIRRPDSPEHIAVAKSLSESGIIVKTYLKPTSNLEHRAGIIHEKMIAIDPSEPVSGIVVQTSANLSDEVYRNKDTWFFILEEQIILENLKAYREVEVDSIVFSS